MREKLIEILKQAPFEGKVLDEWWWEEKIARIADHLIANGVTFATDNNVGGWIPVSERLPKEEDADVTGCVLAIERSDGFARRWEIDGVLRYPEMFTHWMPVPELPKEG